MGAAIVFAGAATTAAAGEACGASSEQIARAKQSSVLLGANFTHYAVGPTDYACGAARPPLPHLAGKGLLQAYDQPGVRETAVRDLKSMVGGGITAIRTLVWFRHDIGEAKWGIVSSAGGRPSARLRENLREFAADVAAAGVRRLTIAMGPSQTNSPKCTHARPGDCFDEGSVGEDIQFTLGVRRALAGVALGKTQLRFDLMNEGCVNPAARRQAEQTRQYLARLLPAYVREFGAADVTVSCADNPKHDDDRYLDRLQFLAEVFDSVNVKVRSFDFHVYQNDPSKLARELGHLAMFGRRNDATISIGESLYDDAAQTSAFSAVVAGQDGAFDEISNWPVSKLSLCRIAIPPPYDQCGLIRTLPLN